MAPDPSYAIALAAGRYASARGDVELARAFILAARAEIDSLRLTVAQEAALMDVDASEDQTPSSAAWLPFVADGLLRCISSRNERKDG